MKTILALLLTCLAACAQMRGPAWLLGQTASAPVVGGSCSSFTNNPSTEANDSAFEGGIYSGWFTNLTGSTIEVCEISLSFALGGADASAKIQMRTAINGGGSQIGTDSSTISRIGGSGWKTNTATWATPVALTNGQAVAITVIDLVNSLYPGVKQGGDWAGTAYAGSTQKAGWGLNIVDLKKQ